MPLQRCERALLRSFAQSIVSLLHFCVPNMIVFYLFVCISAVATVATASVECASSTTSDELDVLLCLKHQLKESGELSSWDRNHSRELWTGVEWSTNFKSVVALNLSNMNLTGELWPFWCRLPSLHSLDLYQNWFTGELRLDCPLCRNSSFHHLESFSVARNLLQGPLPDEIWKMEQLQKLDLAGNNLSGTIPAGIGKLQKLRILWLGGNNFVGSIPKSLANCSNLMALSLAGNNLSGTIPAGIGKLQKLRMLWLGGNNFVGSIPKSLANCSNLMTLSLPENKLSGQIPAFIGKLTHLTLLSLNQNNFRGGIPASLCENSTQLEVIYLYRCGLRGNIPESLGRCSQLQVLNLEDNNLDGVVPEALFNLTQLSRLRLNYNALSGIPDRFSSAPALEELRLDGNYITAEIPLSIGNLTALKALILEHNNGFQGALPATLSNLQSLKFFSASFNNISGQFPDNMRSMPNLVYFSVNRNRMIGQIPGWFGNSTALRQLLLSDNSFIGPIPPQLGNISINATYGNDPEGFSVGYTMDLSDRILDKKVLTKLEYEQVNSVPTVIDLSFNKLTGTIPSELGRLRHLQYLMICNNELSGPIPPALADAAELQVLILFNNRLTGEIPTALTKLTQLIHLNVSNNQLSGPIPTGFQFNTFDASDYAGNAGLCGPPLNKSCRTHLPFTSKDDETTPREQDNVRILFGAGVAFGFVAGFWISFLFIPQWRWPYNRL